MKTEHPEQLAKIEIDADQWQRDIRTFAETTNQALQAIVSQLSNSCTQGHMSYPRRNPTPTSVLQDSVGTPETSPSETFLNSSIPPKQDGDADRLSKLKSQLAQRISRTY